MKTYINPQTEYVSVKMVQHLLGASTSGTITPGGVAGDDIDTD